jgi:hypothetical protein
MITENGVSTTSEPGQFQAERFYSCFSKCWMVQWNYRDIQGRLRSGVARSLEGAKKQAAKHGYREAA